MPEHQYKRYNDGRECPTIPELVAFVENAAAAAEGQCRRLDEHLDRCAFCLDQFEIAARRADEERWPALLEQAVEAAKTRAVALEPAASEAEVGQAAVVVRFLLFMAFIRRAVARSGQFVLSKKFIAGLLVPVLVGTAYATLGGSDRKTWESLMQLFAPAEQPAVTIIQNNPSLTVNGEPFPDRVGTGDALALGAWQTALWRVGGSPGRVLTTEQLKESIAQGGTLPPGPVCIIGGPLASEFPVVLECMARLRGVDEPHDLQALKRGFRFEVLPHGRATAFSRPAEPETDDRPLQLGIRDVEAKELAQVRRTPKNTFDPDAALIMLGNLDGRPLLIVAGYETQGTGAAMKFLLQPSPALTRFYRIYRDEGYAEMVIRTQEGTGEPELFQFDTVENPRGR